MTRYRLTIPGRPYTLHPTRTTGRVAAELLLGCDLTIDTSGVLLDAAGARRGTLRVPSSGPSGPSGRSPHRVVAVPLPRHAECVAAAKAAGVSLSEWVRQCCDAELRRLSLGSLLRELTPEQALAIAVDAGICDGEGRLLPRYVEPAGSEWTCNHCGRRDCTDHSADPKAPID